jgi:hypothetical protein
VPSRSPGGPQQIIQPDPAAEPAHRQGSSASDCYWADGHFER